MLSPLELKKNWDSCHSKYEMSSLQARSILFELEGVTPGSSSVDFDVFFMPSF